jgi:hypothetical protein
MKKWQALSWNTFYNLKTGKRAIIKELRLQLT